MCCVCERSSAASISSRIYIGAGLNWRRAMMRERAISDLYLQMKMPLNQILLFKNEIKKFGVPLASTQFGQALFPYSAKLNFNF